MSLRIRHLEVHVTTPVGILGTRLGFEDGLVILRANNTSGKSTCIMSMLYALGLEGMLGPSQEPPLPDAVRTRIMVDGKQVDVSESHVTLKIENHNHDMMVITRKITGTTKERQFVDVLEGKTDSPQDQLQRRSYFVRTAGAARREAGFHRHLAEFMGLELPEVARTEGGPVPLYLECIVPFFFVDQWTGWREIKARMPTYLQIPEMAKRATEYIARLDVMNSALRRKALEQQAVAIRERWRSLYLKIIADTGAVRMTVRGLPQHPVGEWPPSPEPHVLAHDGQNWNHINVGLKSLQDLHARLVATTIPKAQDTNDTDLLKLNLLEENRDELESKLEQARFEVRTEQQQVDSVEERLRALREDLERYNDEKKLRERGAVEVLRVGEGRCPACDQSISDALLPQVESLNPMSLEENIAFIKEQISMFEEISRESKSMLELKTQALATLRERGRGMDLLIRRQKESMRADGAVPSAAVIQERLQIEGRIDDLVKAHDLFIASIYHMAELSQEWMANEEALKSIDGSSLTKTDEKKLDLVEGSFLAQLRDYGFDSYPVDEVTISRETYRPACRGYDLGFTSASDSIRVIWSYLISMLELARTHETNHPGLLVFDEPRQQSAANISFYALLKRASAAKSFGQQVIFATSQEEEDLKRNLDGVACTYHALPSKILRRMD